MRMRQHQHGSGDLHNVNLGLKFKKHTYLCTYEGVWQGWLADWNRQRASLVEVGGGCSRLRRPIFR